MNDCIFCKIINGELNAYKVYEDEVVLAFLDIAPMTKGHILIMPKRHSDNILQISSVELDCLNKVIQTLSKKMLLVLNAKGFNILSNVNKIAGQSVMHTHIHLIPRYDEEELRFEYKGKKTDFEELKNIQKEIRIIGQ